MADPGPTRSRAIPTAAKLEIDYSAASPDGAANCARKAARTGCRQNHRAILRPSLAKGTWSNSAALLESWCYPLTARPRVLRSTRSDFRPQLGPRYWQAPKFIDGSP